MTARCTVIVDCGPTVGLGHLKRCLVLAAALQRAGMWCRFIVGDPSGVEIAARSGFAADCDTQLSRIDKQANVVVLDGYRFDPSVPRAWRDETSALIVMVDDLGERPDACDVVVNHNLYGAGIDYAFHGARAVLAGPDYALVDPAFVALGGKTRPSPPHVLVSFGGSDDGRCALAVADELIRLDPAVIVEAVLSPLLSASTSAAIRQGAPGTDVRRRIHSGADMPDVMSRAVVYVGAAGVTCMEAIGAGLDVVACLIADNQRRNIETLARMGYATLPAFDAEVAARAALVALARPAGARHTLIDGRGADRVAAVVASLLPHKGNARTAQTGDMVA